MTTPKTVERLFKILRPDVTVPIEGGTLTKLAMWLEKDVATLAERLTHNPTFQDHASWALRVLAPGNKTSERSTIDNLETVLLETVKAFNKALKSKKLTKAISDLYPPKTFASKETIRFGDTKYPEILERELSPFDEFETQRNQLIFLASGPSSGFSLIDTHEYFNVRPVIIGVEEANNGKTKVEIQIQDALTIPSVQPRICPVGNFIVESAILRLRRILTCLESIRVKMSASQNIEKSTKAYQDTIRVWNDLQSKVKDFRKVFQTGDDNTLRNSCMILTQIYAAFHPSPDLVWLVGQSTIDNADALALRARIEGNRGAELFERVSDAIVKIGSVFGSEELTSSVNLEAIKRGDLVIDLENRVVHLEGKLTDFSGNSMKGNWDLLLELVTKAKHGRHASEHDVFGDRDVTKSAFATRINRLNTQLRGIQKFITPGPTQRTYKLNLDRHRIHIVSHLVSSPDSSIQAR